MSAIASSLTVAHILARSPTPSPEITEKHVDLSQSHPPAPSSPPGPSPIAMPVPKRSSVGASTVTSENPEQQPAAPPSIPPPLTNLMVPSKTVAAIATTATFTATATATVSSTTVALGASGLGIGTSDRDNNLATPIPLPPPHEPPAHRPSVQTPPTALNAQLKEGELDGVTLGELARHVRLSKHQERKCANTRVRLQLNLVSYALSGRLLRCGQMAHRGLAECFRGDDRAIFAKLYNTVHDVRRSCDNMWKYALLGPEMDAVHPSTPTRSPATPGLRYSAGVASASASSFLVHIPGDAQDAFLSFLTSLRNNTDYLASRLCSLTSSELAALTAFYHGRESTDPIQQIRNRQFSSRNSPSGRGSSHNILSSSHRQEPNAVQKFMSFHRHDPLSGLIHTCFADSVGPNSAEDKRRTDVWSTACARLISEKGAAGEPVLVAVLNAWAMMRGWAGNSNMEWFLMKILGDGAFLLDRAEDQNGTRFNLNEWTPKDQVAAEEFYDRAVSDLFDVLDDEDATGIPDGLVELGNQILSKLDAKFIENTRVWLVYKWLFGVWLFGLLVHPEAHGLMSEYHITEYGRQKILKEVALRAQRLIADRAASPGMAKSPKSAATPSAIHSHIENIFGRFRGTSVPRRATTRLLPARSVTSLRENTEVYPYLVVSPSDLVTLVQALFPDRQPKSARSGSIRSGRASVSSFSVPIIGQPVPADIQRATADTSSTLSTSISSANTETTNSGPLDDHLTGTSVSHSLPPSVPFSGQDPRRLNNYEDDGYRLRLAVRDMTDALGRDVVMGSGHPCGDHWAVLFISADGNSLSTHTEYDSPDNYDDCPFPLRHDTNDTLHDGQDELASTELGEDYHKLRDSILKLVQDYEIPEDLDWQDVKGSGISTNHGSAPRPPSATSGEVHPTMESASQYAIGDEGDNKEHQCALVDMLQAASTQSRTQSDFLSALEYWNTVQQLNSLESDVLRRNGFAALLGVFSRGPRNSLERSAAAVADYDSRLVGLRQSQEQADENIEAMMAKLQAMRDKMWYVTDVRNSAPYDVSRNVAAALKTMGTSRKWHAYQRARQSLRGPAASYLRKSEYEVVELLAATESQGGPNKLSDLQVEKTLQWLQISGVENFCQGEERIHRFCCELGNCVEQLIGENIIDAPVLWSSELYVKDYRYFESRGKPGRNRDSGSFLWDDLSSTAGFGDSESRRFNMSSKGTSATASGLRTTPDPSTPSVKSFDSGGYSFSRGNMVSTDMFSTQDYVPGGISAVPAIDTTTTYWSPFRTPITAKQAYSRTQSPTASIHNFPASFSPTNQNQRSSRRSSVSLHGYQSTGRPGTSSSSVDMTFAQRISDDKSRFLGNLRQTLTSLLLSDLGNLVFAQGSETDFWFGNIGQQCINQRGVTAGKIQHTGQTGSTAPSSQNSSEPDTVNSTEGPSVIPAMNETVGSGLDGNPDINFPHMALSAEIDNARPIPATPGGSEHPDDLGSVPSPGKTATDSKLKARSPAMPDFPFTKSYQRLLRMFCVHPNPFKKMDALYELENLIMASLPSQNMRRRLALSMRRESVSAPAGDESLGSHIGRAKPLEETIGNVNGRRAPSRAPPPLLTSPMSAHRSSFGGSMDTRPSWTNKDAVSGILKSLFRDFNVRPKTLFRDLQFIASFVPPEVLDGTERGKAFWDAGLAALLLKKEVCDTMVEEAYEIVRVETETRKVRNTPSDTPTASSATTNLPGRVSYTLADAARMWTVTAKEGVPIAQRELGLFYLLYPELVERTTLPLSRPRDVFKKDVMEKYGGSSGSGRNSSHQSGANPGRGPSAFSNSGGVGSPGAPGPGSDVRNDAALMCVAIHWMVAAERGGDESARNFLRQNEMMKAS